MFFLNEYVLRIKVMLFFKNLLSYILAFPIFGILLILGVPLEKEK